ncbi:hypothetical protein [Chryseobacterium wanjuense]
MMTPAEELYSAVVTTELSNTNYEKRRHRLVIQTLIQKIARICGKTGKSLCEKMYLRSVPIGDTTPIVKQASGADHLSRTLTE